MRGIFARIGRMHEISVEIPRDGVARGEGVKSPEKGDFTPSKQSAGRRPLEAYLRGSASRSAKETF